LVIDSAATITCELRGPIGGLTRDLQKLWLRTADRRLPRSAAFHVVPGRRREALMGRLACSRL
jgi:hypothetical protein